MKMDEHRKMVRMKMNRRNIADNLNTLADAIRAIASKGEMDGWNKAVKVCVKEIMVWWTAKDDTRRPDKVLRRLIREDGK